VGSSKHNLRSTRTTCGGSPFLSRVCRTRVVTNHFWHLSSLGIEPLIRLTDLSRLHARTLYRLLKLYMSRRRLSHHATPLCNSDPLRVSRPLSLDRVTPIFRALCSLRDGQARRYTTRDQQRFKLLISADPCRFLALGVCLGYGGCTCVRSHRREAREMEESPIIFG
jgi:hypothetical protein